jgi:hypothetical protein
LRFIGRWVYRIIKKFIDELCNKAMENRKAKILEPNKGKHIAVAGDINTILAFKEDTGGTYILYSASGFN